MSIFLLAAYLIPIGLWNLPPDGYCGYYYGDGVCGCGYPWLEEVREDGFYDYNPGHGSRSLLFLVTPHAECWELTASRTGRKIELRIVDGRVVWVDPATGAREPMRRVRNPWRIWYYQFIGDGKDLRRDCSETRWLTTYQARAVNRQKASERKFFFLL